MRVADQQWDAGAVKSTRQGGHRRIKAGQTLLKGAFGEIKIPRGPGDWRAGGAPIGPGRQNRAQASGRQTGADPKGA